MLLRYTRGGLKRLWSRRWLRRMTYVIASGAVCAYGVRWTLKQSFFNQWAISKLDALVADETGLHFQARRIEVNPFKNYLLIEGFSLGGDLLKADRLLVRADFLSLITPKPRIWNVELENPHLEVDQERLARIHLKPHPPSKSNKDWYLDRCAIWGGVLNVHGGVWGLPDGEFAFRVYGTGVGANRVQLDLRVPKLKLIREKRVLVGSMSLLAALGKQSQELKQGELRLEDSNFRFRGRFDGLEAPCEGTIKGDADLGPIMDFAFPTGRQKLAGKVQFEGDISGSPKNPKWTFNVKGQELESSVSGIRPGALDLHANGTLQRISLKQLGWDSAQGHLQVHGEWKKGQNVDLAFEVDQVSLAPAASYVRVPGVEPLVYSGKGEFKVAGDPWQKLRVNAIAMTTEGRFQRLGNPAGRISARLSNGDLVVDALELDIPECHVNGQAKLRFNSRGLVSVQADAETDTDAAPVADALRRWKIVDLDMSGPVHANAKVGWDLERGLQLTGHTEATKPRWHGAHADQLRADVSIDRDQLRVENIQLERGKGGGTGELWLTWGKLPPGQDEMDMCYRAFRLPIEEGLNAWDAKQTLPITGTGSGWVRIHGPYDRILLEGGASAEDAMVYGMKIPFASGDMNLDLAGNRLLLSDLRVAETAETLGSPNEIPTGLLALRGNLDMDLEASTWKGWLKGNVDSAVLGLGGPRFQARVDLGLDGPWAVPFGSIKLPSASLAINGGRVFFGEQSIEGLEGRVESGAGALEARLQTTGAENPLATLQVQPRGENLIGSLNVHVGSDTGDTTHLAARLTNDFMKDITLDVRADGVWEKDGLRWKGALTNTNARFEGFDLVQQDACVLGGDAAGMHLDLGLQAQGQMADQALASPGFIRVSGSAPFCGEKPLGLKVTGLTELANLKKILDGLLQLDQYSLLGGLNPKGTARFDVGVQGTYGNPSLSGGLSLEDGSLEVRTYPQSIENLHFNMLFKGREILIPESDPLVGRIAQGNIRAWGSATWGLGGLKNYDVEARLKDFQLRDFPGAEGFELQGSLNAGLHGNDEDGGRLQGTLSADHMSYRAEISLGNILAYVMSGSSLSSIKAPDETMSMIDLDLEVKLKEPLEVDTNIVKLQGRPLGTFKFQNTLAEPRLSGTLGILPGGRITNVLPAGDVVIEEGSIAFDPNQTMPFLGISGRIDISPYTVNLAFKGPLDSLKTSASSTPSLRQEEILAILIDPTQASIVGTSMGSSTPSALTSGLAATSSGWLTSLALAEFQDRLRRSFHLDRVNVVWRAGSLGNSTTEITLGKTFYPFDVQTSLVGTHRKVGDITTMSGQAEWRFGNFVLQLGVSQTGSDKAGLAGEIRHTWIPFW